MKKKHFFSSGSPQGAIDLSGNGGMDWSEVQYDELPAAVQAHYDAPADDR